MSLLLLIILVSGVFLVGGVTPKMHDDTLDMKTTGSVQGVHSGSTGSSFAAPGTGSESKKSLQMKQLILTTSTPTPSSRSTSSDEWDISLSTVTCQSGVGKASLTLKGPRKGYLVIEQEIYSGSFTPVDVGEFVSTEHRMTLVLPSSSFFNSRKWRIKLFEGGLITNYVWSGGVERKSSDQNPTSC